MKESTKQNVEQALSLFKKKLSYKEISNQMNRPESTIRRWLAPYNLFGDMREILKDLAKKGNQKNSALCKEKRQFAYDDAKQNAKNHLQDPFLRDFINLYIGEGSKRTTDTISIINSDPKIILLSLIMIKKYFLKTNKKIVLAIKYYKENNNKDELLKYWSKLIGKNKFVEIRTYVQPTVNAIGHNNSNKFGLVKAEIYDTLAKQRLDAYMDYLKEEWTQEFENTFNTKVDRSIIEVKAEITAPVEIAPIKRTKKSIPYPAMPILKQMVAEKGYSGVARELGCNLESVRKHIFRNDTEPREERKKIVYPDVPSLISMVEEKGYLQIGKELGCSDNAIRKYLKNNNIDLKTITKTKKATI